MTGQIPSVSWFWDWVPAAGSDATGWPDSVAALVDGWTGATVGAAMAGDLLAHAAGLAPNRRLMWGAGFLGEWVRWLPLVAIVEFREPMPGDSAYLMGAVGAEGFEDDVREPDVEYLSTAHGDAIRVLALTRSGDGGVHGRVDAALRLERPAGDVDVLLTSRADDLGRLAVIGDGMDALLTMIADQSPELRLVTAGTDVP
jgi:hypothetical protein